MILRVLFNLMILWFHNSKCPVLDYPLHRVERSHCLQVALQSQQGPWLPRVPHPCCGKHRVNAECGANGAWVCNEVCHVDIIACECVYQLLPWPRVRLCLQGSIRRLFILYLFLGKRHWNNMTPNWLTNLKTAELIITGKRHSLLSACLVTTLPCSSVYFNLMFPCRKHKAMGKSISQVPTAFRCTRSLWISQLLSLTVTTLQLNETPATAAWSLRWCVWLQYSF